MPAPGHLRRNPQDLDRQGAEIRLAQARRRRRRRVAVKPARPSPWPAHCRAALAQAIGLAARQFPRPGEDEAARVHDVRKTLKGAAGLARLFTEMIGPPAYAALTTIDGARKAVGVARDLDV